MLDAESTVTDATAVPYTHHKFADTPADHEVIWRYMDLPKFLCLIETRKLHFAFIYDLPDKWEGVIDRRTTAGIQAVFASASGSAIDLFRTVHEHMAVNCWFRGVYESVAMWSLYTKTEYGIAIRTTVGRLKEALAATSMPVYIGAVHYRDPAVTDGSVLGIGELNVLPPLLQKRPCYQHECELRAIANFGAEVTLVKGELRVHAGAHAGTDVPVDLNALVESITLAPSFPDWANGIVEGALKRSGLKPSIHASDALSSPPSPFLEY